MFYIRIITKPIIRSGRIYGPAFILSLIMLSYTVAAADPLQPSGMNGRGTPEKTASKNLTLTWADIVKLVDRHPRIIEGLYLIEAARGAKSAAGSAPNPILDATMSKGVSPDGAQTRFEWGLQLNVPLNWIAQRRYRIDSANALIGASIAESALTKREVLLRLRILFWNIVHEKARVEALEKLKGQTAALAGSVKRRVEMGEIRPIEETRILIELDKTAVKLDEAGRSLAGAREQLKLWLGLDGDVTVDAGDELYRFSMPSSLENALESARTGHPVVVAAREKVRSLSFALKVEKMARVPGLSLNAFTFNELDRNSTGGGLTVDLPLWNWNSGGIAQAEGQLEAGKMRIENEIIELESAIIESRVSCASAVQSALTFSERVAPNSEKVFTALEKSYQEGETALYEVIDARRMLLDTRLQYLAALNHAQIECSRYKSLTGEEDMK